jgi:hypothetical protein
VKEMRKNEEISTDGDGSSSNSAAMWGRTVGPGRERGARLVDHLAMDFGVI